MPDVPIQPTPAPTRAERTRESLTEMAARAEEGARAALTGDSAGRLRRPILFIVVGLALVLNLPALGLVALLLLVYTDQVVPL